MTSWKPSATAPAALLGDAERALLAVPAHGVPDKSGYRLTLAAAHLPLTWSRADREAAVREARARLLARDPAYRAREAQSVREQARQRALRGRQQHEALA